MVNYEQLMHDASKGDKKAFDELYSRAGYGSAEAQYYLAIYYKEGKGDGPDSDYAYWMKKAKSNGFDATKNIVINEPNDIASEITESESYCALKKLLMKFSFMGRINRTEYIISIIGSILLIFIVNNVEYPIIRLLFKLLIDVFLLSQCARRLHDFGVSGWYAIIPVVSWIYAAFPQGDESENEYGLAPFK